MFIFNLWSVVLINSYLIGLGCGLKLRFLKAFQIILISSQEREPLLWESDQDSELAVCLSLRNLRLTEDLSWARQDRLAADCDTSHRPAPLLLPVGVMLCLCPGSWVVPHHQAIKCLHDLSSWGCNSTVIRIVFLLFLFFSCFVLLCIYLDSKYCESHTNIKQMKLWLLLPNPHS